MKKVVLSLLCLVGLMAAANVALADQSQYKKLTLSGKENKYKSLDLPKHTDKNASRLTWSTNMVEWFLFAPNVGIEVDLKDPTLITCPSIFLQFSYRPGKEDFLKHEHFNTNALYYWRARAEYRWHFRFNERREQRKGLAKAAIWANEQFFTKPIETLVPDTAAINAGQEGATKYVMSKEGRIREKIDSTMNSTLLHKQELFPGRYYLGAYGEYMNFTFNNRMIPIFGKDMKQGVIYSAGLSGGYDFPGFNFNHKCFLQWSVGASLGLLWFNYDEYNTSSKKDAPAKSDITKVLPFLTEIKVALNFRNSTISKKYWQPDPAVYTDNIRRNHEDSIHMAELDTILAENPVVINVTSVNGVDSAYIETIDKNYIVNEFRRATGLTYLMPNDFNMLQTTQEGIDKRELNDNYFIEYTTTNRLRHYQDSTFINDRKNLPFKLQIAGRELADSLKKSFTDSLRNYYAANNTRPVFYGEPATKDSLKGFISKDSIAAQFSRIWGQKLDTAWIRNLYVSYNVTEDDGSTTTYYDSIITERDINRRESYGFSIQFHPQVMMNAEDDGVCRFRVAMAGADNARELYNKVASFINAMARAGIGKIRIQRPWNGVDDTYQRRVTKDEIMAALQNYGLNDVDERVVFVTDTATHFHEDNDSIIFNFGVTENPLKFYYEVGDSVGKAMAQALFNDTIRPWRDEQYWVPSQGLYDDDPKVPGYLDTVSGEWYVNPDKFIEAVKDITFANLKPYMVDSVLWRIQPKPYKVGQLAGKYRAQAKLIFHREWKNRAGGLFSTNIPYVVVPVESKEEAGWIPPVVEAPVDSTSAAMRDSVVYVLDSLGNIIDSTLIQVPVLTPDSVALDSAMQSSMVGALGAGAGIIPTASEQAVKQLTVAEATAASQAAAALAKTTAAEAKLAAAAAKKAKGVAAKAGKDLAAAEKKANASMKSVVPETTVETVDSIVYTTDSLGAVIDSSVVKVEHKVAANLDEAQQAAVAARDSMLAGYRLAADSTNHVADSLVAVAEAAAARAAEAKLAAAEAKKAIAVAKKAEKAAAAEAKKRAKEEAAAAKAAAKGAVAKKADEVGQAAGSATASASAAVSAAASAATSTSPVSPTATETQQQAAPARSEFTTDNNSSEASAPVADNAPEVDPNRPMTVAEANQALAAANTLVKTTAAEAKTAAADLKKEQKNATALAKKAAAAQKKVPVLPEGEEPSEAVLEARELAASLQSEAELSAQRVDSLRNVVTELQQKVAETKNAAAEAKKTLAEAKKAEKAAAAEAKKRAKEEAAAAKAAAKAEADAKKAAEAEAKRLAEEEAAAAKAAEKAAADEAEKTTSEESTGSATEGGETNSTEATETKE